MKEIYITDSTKNLGYSQGNLVIRNQDFEKELEVSLKLIDCINLFGNPQVTTTLVKAMAIKGKNLHYYSQNGKYITSIMPSYADNYNKQRAQFSAMEDEEFKLKIARKFIENKLFQQNGLIQAFDTDVVIKQSGYQHLVNYREGVLNAQKISSVLGYEGKAATHYFRLINQLLPVDYRFPNRNKRPAKDPYNSLINFGYSILYGYFKGAIHKYGLNPGFGFLHSVDKDHAALASDLMEEWRAIIVDDVALKMIFHDDLQPEMFTVGNNDGVYLTTEGRQLFISLLHKRMDEKHVYYSTLNKKFNFHYAVTLQIESLIRSIESKDHRLYYQVGR